MLAFFPRWRESASRNKSIGEGPIRTAVVDSERMVLCEEEVVTIIKKKIPLQLVKQVPSESLLRLLLELFSLKVVKWAEGLKDFTNPILFQKLVESRE